MRTRSRTTFLSTMGAAALSLALLTGCASPLGGGASGTSDSSAPGGYVSAEQGQDASAPAAGSDPSLVTDRALVTTGEIGITTSDVAAATATTEELVAALEGRIDSRSERSGSSTTTTLTVRVPAEDYEALIEQLREVGTVEYVTTTVDDVTMVTVDLDARITSLEASVESLRAMLEQATTVEDMLEVEETLSAREAELQSLKAQQTALADQVAMSTLTVTISNDELANPTPDDNGGFLSGLQSGWNTLIAFFSGLLTVLGFMLPGLIVLAILAAIVVMIVRLSLRARRNRRAAAPGPATAPPSTGPAPSDGPTSGSGATAGSDPASMAPAAATRPGPHPGAQTPVAGNAHPNAPTNPNVGGPAHRGPSAAPPAANPPAAQPPHAEPPRAEPPSSEPGDPGRA